MSHFSKAITEYATDIILELSKRGQTISTAESCTGGLIASALTDISGSSKAVYGGFVTYSNDAKKTMLGVSPATLEQYGAVSELTAREMAEGARKATSSDFAISVTGIAGPTGGSDEKPVGLVHFSLALENRTIARKWNFGDIGREQVRDITVLTALELICDVLHDRV